jgi:hypothetical protein
LLEAIFLLLLFFLLYRRTVLDKLNMKEIILTDEEVEMVRRIQSGTFAHADFNDQQVSSLQFKILFVIFFLLMF